MGLESLIPKKSPIVSNPQSTLPVSNADAPYPFSGARENKKIVSDSEIQKSLGREAVIPREDNAWPHKEVVPEFPKHTESFSDKFKPASEKEVDRSFGKKQGESVFQIEVERIKPNPYQPRKHFDDSALRELAQSVREFGVIQPIIVSKVTHESERGADVYYELIAGERRLMASKIAGLPRIPAIIRNIDADGRREKLELALIENIQRHDLNAIDEARAYAKLSEEFGLTQREIALRAGKSREVVANTMRLLSLSFEMQEALVSGRMSQGDARSLLSIENPEARNRKFLELLGGRESVQKTNASPSNNPLQNPEEKFLERQLEEHLGAPVKIVRSNKGGKIVISFYSDEERSGVFKRIVGENSSD